MDLSDKKIRIGVLKTDGVVTPTGPIQRGLSKIVDRLRASERFELVDVEIIKSKEAWALIVSAWSP